MAPAARTAARALGVLLSAGAAGRAAAQLYQFDAAVVPEGRSMQTMYAFYVFSHADTPDRSMGSPFVKFHQLALHTSSARENETDAKLSSYQSLQLSFLPYWDFWRLIDPNQFCSTAHDVQMGKASKPHELLVRKDSSSVNYMYTHTLSFGQGSVMKDAEANIRATGVYVLAFSNCGEFDQATLTGSVIVKNSYGFLPGNEYYKMPFYGVLSLVYTAIGVFWATLSMRYWRDILYIQSCISGVIFLGLVEAFLWWIMFSQWNNSGNRNIVIFILAILCTVLKSIFSYMLVLVASLGWGVTRPFLDQRTILKIQGVSVLYIILDFIREVAIALRHSHTFSMPFVVTCLLPVSLLNGIIFHWIFTALSGLIETLAERRQEEKLTLFQNLSKLLALALLCAFAVLAWQIFDLSTDISIRWHYQWFYADAIPHLLFLWVLAVIMYLWAPNRSSKNKFAYSQPGSKDPDDDAKVGAWDEALDDDGDEDDAFWATTSAADTSAVPATKLGAATEVEA